MSGIILLVDPSPSQRLVLKSRLAAAHYEVTALADGPAALAALRARRADLVLLGSDTGEDWPVALLRDMRADPGLAAVPAILLLPPAEAALRREALAGGADEVLARPADETLLLSRLRNLMRRQDLVDLDAIGVPEAEFGMNDPAAAFVTPGTVALVAGRAEVAIRLRTDLAPLMRDRIAVMTRAEALAEPAGAVAPDLYVIDADLGTPGGGLRFLSELQAHGTARHAAFCLLRSQPAGAADDAMAFDLGAGDVIAPGTDPQDVALRLRALLRRKRTGDGLRARLRDGLRLAVTDPLTGLHNRRYGEAQLATLAERARAEGAPCAVMVLDLDHFKSVNDRFGHAAGDAVLVEVARRLAANLRQGDLLARIGGEEFLIALPGAGLGEARGVAERLCAAMQERAFALPSGGSLTMTASIGLALSKATVEEPATALIDRADQALLTSKAAGRNQVTVCRRVA